MRREISCARSFGDCRGKLDGDLRKTLTARLDYQAVALTGEVAENQTLGVCEHAGHLEEPKIDPLQTIPQPEFFQIADIRVRDCASGMWNDP